MQVGKENRILILIFLCLAVALPGACTYKGGSGRVFEMQEFDSFFSTHSDSVVMAPRWMKAQALQRMERTKDSMVRYNYLAVALKTCLATSDFDSAQLLLRQVEAFVGRQPFSHRLADLQSECFNIKGNVYSRKGYDLLTYVFQSESRGQKAIDSKFPKGLPYSTLVLILKGTEKV